MFSRLSESLEGLVKEIRRYNDITEDQISKRESFLKELEAINKRNVALIEHIHALEGDYGPNDVN